MKGESGFEIVTHLALTVIRPSQHLKSIESAACRRRLLINCGGFWTRFSHALSVSRGFESGANSWPVYVTSKIGNIYIYIYIYFFFLQTIHERTEVLICVNSTTIRLGEQCWEWWQNRGCCASNKIPHSEALQAFRHQTTDYIPENFVHLLFACSRSSR
jgi:hypothetical protein